MNKTIRLVLTVFCSVALLSGCATIKRDIQSGVAADRAKSVAGAALGAAAIAQPQYAGAIKQLQALLSASDKSSPVDGFTFSRTYFYEGRVVSDPSQISWKDQWTKTSDAGKDTPPSSPTSAHTATESETISIAREDLKVILEAATSGSEK